MTTPEPTTPQWAATVRPGDTLVVGFSRELSHDDGARMVDAFKQAIPGVRTVVVGEVASMAVRKGDADA